MQTFLALLLLVSLISGQVVKLPLIYLNGLTLLDLSIIIINLFALLNLKFRLKKPPLPLVLTGLFLAIATLSLILTPLRLSPSEYLSSFSYTARFGSYILLGWLLYSGALPSFTRQMSKILLSSGIIIASLGLIQFIFLPNLSFLAKDGWDPHNFRTASTFFDPNFLGAYLIFTLVLLAAKIIPLSRKLSFIFFLILYLAIVTTFSRSVALMFITSFLSFSLFKRSFKWFALTLILCSGFYLGYLVYHQAVASPLNINRGQSAEYRLTSWQQGIKMVEASPLLGVGFNSYRYALDYYKLSAGNFTQSRGASGNDSSLLFTAATTGILGLFSYLAVIASLIIISLKKYYSGNKAGIVLLSGLLGLLIHSFFLNSLFYPFILVWLVLLPSQFKTPVEEAQTK